MSKQSLEDHLIDKYRSLVSERYEYNSLDQLFFLDELISEDLVKEVRNYFLNYIYPSSEKRKILNQAFEHLEKHLKNPAHLLRLVGDASGVVFRFGFQFPKALKAGMNSLMSFKAASEFEKGLLEEAKRKKLSVPVSTTDFELLILALPESQMRKFINDFDELLSALTDTKLLKKTIEIMGELIAQMKKHPKVYSEIDIAGMSMGLAILENGFQLFQGLTSEEKEAIISLIIQAENRFLDDLYEAKA